MKSLLVVALGAKLGFSSCSHESPPPPPPPPPAQLELTPAADQQARTDLQTSIDTYVATAPKIRDYRATLNPNMYALQGDGNDPVPTNMGLAKAVPPPTATGVDAFSPVIVKAVRARLRDALLREATDDEVVAEITTTESQQRADVVAALEGRRDDIAAIYAAAVALNQAGRTDEGAAKLREARALRESVIADWHRRHGVAPGKTDSADEAVTPEQAAEADRQLLGQYLNNGVVDSP